MTNLTTVQELTEVIQSCLTSKLRTAHTESISLTLDIAREVATEIELRCKEYTNLQITELMDLMHDPETDLGIFRDFINSIKGLLDGDDDSDGYQVFNLLVSDTISNKETLGLHELDLNTIKERLTQTTLLLSEHNVRLMALEAQPTTTEVKGEVVELIESVFESACLAVADRLSEYKDLNHLNVMEEVKVTYQEHLATLDISLLPSDNLLLTCKLNLPDISEIDLIVDGSQAEGTVTFNFEKQILSALLITPAEDLIGKVFTITVNDVDRFSGVFQQLINYPLRTTFT